MGTGKNAIDGSHVHRLARNPFIFITFFPKGKVDIVSPMPAIMKNNKCLVLFKKKPFAKLPRVKHLLSNVIKWMVKTTTKILNFLILKYLLIHLHVRKTNS